MKKYQVEYASGPSRHGDEGIDYMLVVVDSTELYAEAPPVDGDETGSYDELKAAILEQAAEKGIDPNILVFAYDNCHEIELVTEAGTFDGMDLWEAVAYVDDAATEGYALVTPDTADLYDTHPADLSMDD